MGVRTGISFGPSDFAQLRSRPAPAASAAPKPIDTLVYVISSASGVVKIGISGDPLSRLAQLQTASAAPLELVYAAAVESGDGYPIEQAAHDLLDRHRQSGEWFNVSPDMAVAAIAGAAHRLRQPIIEVPRDKLRAVLNLAAQRRASETPEPVKPSAPPRKRGALAFYGTLPIAALFALSAFSAPDDKYDYLLGATACVLIWFAAVYVVIFAYDNATGKVRP